MMIPHIPLGVVNMYELYEHEIAGFDKLFTVGMPKEGV